MTFEIIAVIANISFALSFIAAVIFGIAQVRQARRERRERLTLETLRNFQTRDFAELLFYVSRRQLPSGDVELASLPEEEQIRFIEFAQQMESLGILVAENFIDLDLVDKTLGSFVVDAWEKYKPTVTKFRESEPYSNEYFQWLAERIEKRMKEEPRKPFYEQ
jgi:hypothetical protein